MSRNRVDSHVGALNVLECDDAATEQNSEVEIASPDLQTTEEPFLNYAKELEEKPSAGHGGKIRFAVLGLAGLSVFGTFFFNILFTTLQRKIIVDWNKNQTDLQKVTSIGSVPGIVLPLVAGLLADRIGIRLTIIIASIIILISNSIISFAIFEKNLDIILIGNIVGAFGEAPIGICRNALLVKWFVGKELSFALGFVLCMGRFGSSVSSWFSPMIYEAANNSLTTPYLVGLILCIVSTFSIIGLAIIDRRADLQHHLESEETHEEKKKKPLQLRDLKRFKLIYFLVGLNTGIMYMSVFGFNNMATDILQQRFGFDIFESGKLMVIVYICPLIVTPAVGALTDKIGKRITIIICVAIVLLITHIGIAHLYNCAPGEKNYAIIFGLLSIGICYAVYAAIIWPCVALTVNEKLTGLAYGLIGCFQSLLGAGYPNVLARINLNTINDEAKGYYWTQITLAGVAVAGIITAIAIYFVDKTQNHSKLNRPGTGRKVSIRERVYSHMSGRD